MADMPEVSQPPPHPLDSEWETLFGDKTYGPYTGHRIKAFIAEGRVTAETQVRIVGTEAWGGAGNADGLAPLFHNPAHTVGMGIRNAGDSFGYMLKRSRKSRALAVLFSLIICGLGQVYTGRIWKGLFMFLLAWVIVLSGIWPIAFLIAIYSAFDAYFCAVSVNRALDEFSQNSQTLTG